MTEQAISPLRRRMIEDMTIRKFAQKTQHDYVQRVKDFASYLKRSPDTAKPEDVRGFQLHLTSSSAGVPKIALRFTRGTLSTGSRREFLLLSVQPSLSLTRCPEDFQSHRDRLRGGRSSSVVPARTPR